MPTLYVMCGISGIGKSTYARSISEHNVNATIVSTDAIRERVHGDASNQSQGYLIFKMAYEMINSLLSDGYDVIFDATNVTRKSRKELLKNVKVPCKKIINVFPVSPQLAIEQQKNRTRQVPVEVIMRQAQSYVAPTKEEGWDETYFLTRGYMGQETF